MLEKCPVCSTGNLDIEERTDNILGIPRVRRTVQCDNCRSLLREVGNRRWRYAVDGTVNPEMYESYNNQTLQEADLQALEQQADGNDDAPSYVE